MVSIKRRSKQFEFETTEFGIVDVYDVRKAGEILAIAERVGGNTRKVPAKEIAVALFSVTAYPKDCSPEENMEQGDYAFTVEQANKLTDEELEDFVGRFLEHHNFINGKPPRNDDESNIDYLKRSKAVVLGPVVDNFSDQVANMDKFKKALEGFSQFANPLGNISRQMAKTVEANRLTSDRLGESIARLNLDQKYPDFTKMFGAPKNENDKFEFESIRKPDTLKELEEHTNELARRKAKNEYSINRTPMLLIRQ